MKAPDITKTPTTAEIQNKSKETELLWRRSHISGIKCSPQNWLLTMEIHAHGSFDLTLVLKYLSQLKLQYLNKSGACIKAFKLAESAALKASGRQLIPFGDLGQRSIHRAQQVVSVDDEMLRERCWKTHHSQSNHFKQLYHKYDASFLFHH